MQAEGKNIERLAIVKNGKTIAQAQIVYYDLFFGWKYAFCPKGYVVAGKTGTAQIAVEGHYDAEKTTASFIGFAPAKNPKFVMIVKLSEPQTSQWASETAAPLWFSIAKKLLIRYNIAPSN